MSRKRITAADLVARLNKDPLFVSEREREEAERQRQEFEWRRAEAPLVAELRTAGFAVDSVWDLVNVAGPYPAAVPILLAHIRRPYPAAVREGIARALAVPESIVGWELLTRLYADEPDPRAKDGLAVAIAAAADGDLIGDVIGLVCDSRNGPSRLLLLRALERSRDPRAYDTLLRLRTDPELTHEVGVIMDRLRRSQT